MSPEEQNIYGKNMFIPYILDGVVVIVSYMDIHTENPHPVVGLKIINPEVKEIK